MKSSVVTLLVVGAVIVGGAIIYLDHQKAPPPESVAQSVPLQTTGGTPSGNAISAKSETPAVSEDAGKPSPLPAAVPVAAETKPDGSTNVISKLVDALLTAKGSGQKHALFDQLRQSGRLNEVIAELKQRMTQNPNDVEIPTTLGEAQLNRVRAIKEAGGDINEMGIMAMQADQSFNAALKIDPANYEAQLVKAISQTFWPAEPTRDGQVVQTLSSLIDRQETMTPQPGFAQTYLYLGNEYQKIGEQDKARATWQLGLQKFPSDPALQNKISGQ